LEREGRETGHRPKRRTLRGKGGVLTFCPTEKRRDLQEPGKRALGDVPFRNKRKASTRKKKKNKNENVRKATKKKDWRKGVSSGVKPD